MLQYSITAAEPVNDWFFLPAAEPTTWADACAIEPGLLHLEEQARFLGRSLRGRGRLSTWRRIKTELSTLAGWEAREPLLASSSVYEVVYRTILSAFENGGAK